MRLFRCAACEQLLYFENRLCVKCGHDLGYVPETHELAAIEPEGDGTWRSLGRAKGPYRFCANAAHDACNWLIPAQQQGEFCIACRHNRMVPDITIPENLRKWQKVEIAKHRLIYSLLRLKLPLESNEDRQGGLCFEFLADAPEGDAPRVMTGHDEGLITIALAEADDAEREHRKMELGELYRTLLGHFRHEVGHYYWNRLVRDEHRLEAFRTMFGDERADYGAALQTYYANPPPMDWQASHVSAYATSHPWEDFAETFKHYVHIVDTLEMAASFGMRVRPRLDKTGELEAEVDFNPYRACAINQMIDAWLPISFALNSLNRCLGMTDAYPFILGPGVIAKIGFIHDLVHNAVPQDAPVQDAPPPVADAPAPPAGQPAPEPMPAPA